MVNLREHEHDNFMRNCHHSLQHHNSLSKLVLQQPPWIQIGKPEKFHSCPAMIAELCPVLGHQINEFEWAISCTSYTYNKILYCLSFACPIGLADLLYRVLQCNCFRYVDDEISNGVELTGNL